MLLLSGHTRGFPSLPSGHTVIHDDDDAHVLWQIQMGEATVWDFQRARGIPAQTDHLSAVTKPLLMLTQDGLTSSDAPHDRTHLTRQGGSYPVLLFL